MDPRITRMREQLSLFDPSEIQDKIRKAQLRVRGEALLPGLRSRYDLDANTALLILEEAVAAGSDDEEVAFALDGIAATWVGESTAWEDAAARVDRKVGQKATSVTETLGQMHEVMHQIMTGGSAGAR